ncbi:hypothetical protein ACQPYK_46740 [Streptosporangium sp. CA-135522]|uniref:hypothetical protein n=1 Tax=Streptosporangium sp. CA-135522 TaxID=3240072 RepID=UPI003D8C6B78
MIGNPRTPGRHRAGLAPVAVVPRRLWDGPARAEAERLDGAWPGWTVLYGAGGRRFYAMATWPTPEALIVSDPTPEGLEAQMHDAEMARIVQRRPYAPVPAGAGRS